MTDSDEDEAEEVTFDVELTASQLYSLQAILNYASIEIEDPHSSLAAETLAKLVTEEIASAQFNDTMDEEMEEVYEDLHGGPEFMDVQQQPGVQ